MADASEVEAQVIEVVGEQLEKQGSVKIDSNFIEDLDADSLDTVEIIMSLEEKFDIEISEDDAQKMVTVKDAVDYISANV
ncbi:Acyl carrier protein [Ectocarpus siliculosus]|uniref:Acyl carrier protein n=1 Tax=Ectocarpus siliculosus TaxID=2880 RepID=D7FUM5_ECTSI|nr:Acyl carrier protein [Ectocarpus siliculosus]|eukprot:CBJ31692.1 Acyl carrier protein [Ectocarpus siliculosus]